MINVDFMYPIGSIYLSVNNTNPSKWFGGTWVAWGTGRVPVGVDTTQDEFNTVEKTGGEKTHTLTISEMPSHRHEVYGAMNGNSGGRWCVALNSDRGQNWSIADEISYTGGGGAHNNLQPYITCYMWKRTA